MADYYSQGPVGGAPPPNTYTNNTSGAHNEFPSNNVPAYPGWLKFLLIPIFLFTICVLGLVGYSAAMLESGSDSIGFNIFTCVWTILILIFFVLALGPKPQLHFKWAILGLAIVTTIFWLTAFAYLASNTHTVNQALDIVDSYGSSIYGYGFRLKLRSLDKRQLGISDIFGAIQTLRTVAKCMAAGAGVGAIVWILWLVFTIIYAIALFRGQSSAAPMAPAAAHEPKVEMQPYGQAQASPPYVPTQTPQPYPPTQTPQPYAPTLGPEQYGQPGAYTPAKPEGFYDPRTQEHFMTPPPPPSQGTGYVNPQFGQQPIQEMPTHERSNAEIPSGPINEMPTPERSNAEMLSGPINEMPAGR